MRSAGQADVFADFPLHPLVGQLLAEHTQQRWTARLDEFWCRVEPAGHRYPRQGWKLHLSATPLSAPIMLYRAARVLIAHGCAFKYAKSLDRVADLCSTRWQRGAGGKFVTAYPNDDEQFRRLAEELDRATAHLPGPKILSDRPYRVGSLVHYRFGGFDPKIVLSNDGEYVGMLVAPDGTQEPDRRLAWFSPPAWAVQPLPAEAARPTRTQPPAAVLLADRFVVHTAIQHANKGGVYRATDRSTGAEVVIKEARPHVGATIAGTDVRDVLRCEARALELLAPTGLVPGKVALWEQQGNLFLAEQYLPGRTLREWAVQGADRAVADSVPVSERWATASRLVNQLLDLVTAAHDTGVVLCDLNPNNVLVADDGSVRLVDLEAVTCPGTPAICVMTPGFTAPEQVDGPPFGPAPQQPADLYALGATILFAVACVAPLLPADAGRPDRLRRLVEAAAREDPVLARLAPLVLGLLRQDPGQRWTIERARDFLRTANEPEVARVRRARPQALPLDRLIRDGLDHVLDARLDATADTARARLWPSGPFGTGTDTCNVQHGAGGVLAVLVRAAAATGEPRLRAAVGQTAEWIRRQPTPERVLPGLYFGRAGTAWALHEAGSLLGDADSIAFARDLADALPVGWPNPDVCHGAAGAGMALLHLWRATGDEGLAEKVRACADGLVRAAARVDGVLCWPVPATFASTFAGQARYGFGHGVAGIGTFLLAAGQDLGQREYLDLAEAAGQTLRTSASAGGVTVYWPERVGSAQPLAPGMGAHWCSGASGIGTFLVRLCQATGADWARELALRCAATVLAERWRSSPAACHGLAGDGDFLLDLAETLDAPELRGRAEDLLESAYLRHAMRADRLVFPDETMLGDTVDYGTGLCGVLAFLLRLRYGGARMWMPERCSAPAGRLAAAGAVK
jgi:hypothetical protein